MRIVCISDTHLQVAEDFPIPNGDVLIHAGDATINGTIPQVVQFAKWLSSYPHKYKIFVPGNHDYLFEKSFSLAKSLLFVDTKCLVDEGIEIDGVKFWGTPYQPRFMDWAFNVDRGPELKQHWDMIPDDTDVLITHSPPFGIRDLTWRGESVGDVDLGLTIEKRLFLEAHIFGHIHHSYGMETMGTTRYVNASCCNEQYFAANSPIVIDI